MDSFTANLIADGNLAAVALVAFLEKLIPFGPSTILYITLGALTVTAASLLPAVVGAALVGSVAGGLFWYGIGQVADPTTCRRMAVRVSRYVLLPRDSFDRVAEAFHRNQVVTTVVGHTIPTVRVYIGLPAGLFRMPLGRFLPAAALGTLLWVGPLITTGALLRNSGADLVHVGLGVVATVILAEVGLLLGLRYLRRRQGVSRDGSP